MPHDKALSLSMLRVTASLALTLVIATAACADAPASATRLVLTIEEAIDIAKRCILEQHIQVAGSFIESARFERNPRGDRGPYWRVTWAPSREIKGGQVFVTVSIDRKCELTYGE